ncbi:hypothetical protein GLOIN_2v1873476 [Rhizophagus irregularis DAOM 181602=DAOM 197198]|uniref:Protein kinase domain-containing protein n=1 Tax=Rhizophagus irregularis (strain DAOM 181602 / DAOM 197198 / MUCL 43194) TaxID=747089 RepID=A0A2P4QA69_RHIID|nr:hypothetical protein GLOIN_2v1873476 [Rhizophagus irregularis DAOM 181602=DAOM 197198]POG74516.1 hypothetical protein GLOIN_2v1873476 [Rhizophagus irregularis DAOM 181602=DAOM 197198]|eukprot:XP_025181382.1 hypothetical protein GLOIN_2v1873476 [Rhizophagus irregularis DAOM 181602=DAOM 197198]
MFATLYCEFCVRETVKESLIPYMIIEWIPYENLQNFKYLIQGGLSKIYSADWIDGHYKEWDHEESSVHRDLHSGNILYSKKKMIEEQEGNNYQVYINIIVLSIPDNI